MAPAAPVTVTVLDMTGQPMRPARTDAVTSIAPRADKVHEHHLHLHRRGPGTGDPLVPSRHRGLRALRRIRRRAARHLARGPDPLAVPRAPDRRAARARRA